MRRQPIDAETSTTKMIKRLNRCLIANTKIVEQESFNNKAVFRNQMVLANNRLLC